MEILKCPKCNIYTLKKNCSKCQIPTISPKPAKYSPIDKWGKYRRIAKNENNKN